MSETKTELRDGWIQRIGRFTAVECPGCLFTFNADHCDDGSPDDEPHYTCPCCNYGAVPSPAADTET